MCNIRNDIIVNDIIQEVTPLQWYINDASAPHHCIQQLDKRSSMRMVKVCLLLFSFPGFIETVISAADHDVAVFTYCRDVISCNVY